MANRDQPPPGDATPEGAALLLLYEIVAAEDVRMLGRNGMTAPTRKWILQTYADCLKTVRTGVAPEAARTAARK